ncbi:MAG TPA: MOSC domain-containing protein [Acidimicrobiales bacterium]|nr:MOSC domain-containing protein [Acidimicrobiales bacterium]
MGDGRIEGIYLKSARGERTFPVDEVKAMAGEGLEGDPYVASGDFGEPGRGHQLTLITREEIEELASEGVTLRPGESRRQLETRGVDLKSLIGKRFRVGDVECVGIRVCAPCQPLQNMTGKPVMLGLKGKGGLRADIVSTGVIRVGDPIVALEG